MGNRKAALLRGILNPRARREKMHSEGRDLGDVLASWVKDVAQYRIAAGANLQQAVQVPRVMEHAPAAYRGLLEVVLFETYQILRAYVREWPPAQRTFDYLGRHMARDTSAPMDIVQAKGVKGKGETGKCKKRER